MKAKDLKFLQELGVGGVLIGLASSLTLDPQQRPSKRRRRNYEDLLSKWLEDYITWLTAIKML